MTVGAPARFFYSGLSWARAKRSDVTVAYLARTPRHRASPPTSPPATRTHPAHPASTPSIDVQMYTIEKPHTFCIILLELVNILHQNFMV